MVVSPESADDGGDFFPDGKFSSQFHSRNKSPAVRCTWQPPKFNYRTPQLKISEDDGIRKRWSGSERERFPLFIVVVIVSLLRLHESGGEGERPGWIDLPFLKHG